jgi:hypothetical protein
MSEVTSEGSDLDSFSKRRISKWLAEQDLLHGDYNGYVDTDAVESLLLAFEKFLTVLQEERMRG